MPYLQSCPLQALVHEQNTTHFAIYRLPVVFPFEFRVVWVRHRYEFSDEIASRSQGGVVVKSVELWQIELAN